MMRRRVWVGAVLLLATTLIAAACGGDDADDGAAGSAAGTTASEEQATTEDTAARVILATQGVTQASDEDIAYFTAVQGAFQLFGSAAAGAAQESLEGGETRDAFFHGLLNRGVGTAFVPVLEALRELQPPVHYAEGHASVVAQVEQQMAIDADIREAVLAEDLLSFFLLNAQLARVGAESALRQQPNLCRTLSRGGANCSSYEVNDDSAYAVALRDIAAALQGAVVASEQAFAGPLGEDALQDRLAPEEWATLIATLFGERVLAEEEALDALRALEPPAEFAAEQADLIALIESTKETNTRIAADAAAGTLQSLRVTDPQFETLRRAQCDAVAEMSEEFRQVALLSGRDFDRTCADAPEGAS
ncbi:MAG: hypothetical protein DK306_000481 [Chloroflexi bacterium]|nr:MAG: hypothetical protein DK306_000481 [Chloroflexota bacterium]